MKSKKFSYPPLQIGTSFMLLIFVILCMVTFAVLSLSSSMKDYEYSMKNAERTTEYYEACNQAEEKLAQIDEDLKNNVVSDEIIKFAVPVNESESLQVILETHPQQFPRYSIITWKQVSDHEWSGDQSLPVLGGK